MLTQILAHKKEEVAAAQRQRPLAELQQACRDLAPTRGLARVLREGTFPAILAEIKKASPSKGIIRADFDAVSLAQSYARGGAAALSVLTDARYFQGHSSYLQQVRQAVDVPLLRKEFIVSPYQVYEARYLGADGVLLIVAALTPAQLNELTELAQSLDLDVLVEAHDASELEQALATPAPLVGVNNRNLQTFVTDLATGEALLPRIGSSRVAVAESGLYTAPDLLRLQRAGARAFLIGEAFMRQPDPGAALQALREDVWACA